MDQEASFSELFEHREWVRALAERLCADASAAEDVAQDTWVEALRDGGKARGARAWLGGVVRHLAARRSVRDEARGARERHVARREAVPGPEELLAQAELQRRVLAAVAGLQESYRVVVLLRYYEGLKPEVVARRLGEPGSTVRNRLARAHAALRVALDREYDGGTAAWAGLLMPTAGWSATGKVAVGVGMGAKVYVGAGAVALVAAIAWWGSGESNDAQSDLERSPPAAALDTHSERPAAPTTAERGAEAQRVELAPDRTPRFDKLLVWGELRGASGALEGGSLTFLDSAGLDRTATLGAAGSYSLFGLAPGTWRVSAWFRGYLPLDVETSLDGSSEKVRRDFELVAALTLPVKLVDAATGELLGTQLTDPIRGGLGVAVTRAPATRISGVKERAPRLSEAAVYYAGAGLRGNAAVPRGYSGLLILTEPPPVHAHAMLRDTVIASRLLDGSERELEFRIDVAALASATGALVVRCVDAETGAPIAGARIEPWYADGGGGEDATTDAEGLARFEQLAPGPRMISAWVEARPGASAEVRIESRVESQLELAVPRAARVIGRVVGPQGEGVAAQLELLSLEGPRAPSWWRLPTRTTSRADGQFEFPLVPAGRQRLLASADGFALAVLDIDATGAEPPAVALRLERGAEVTVTSALGVAQPREVVLLDASGNPIAFGTVAFGMPLRWTLTPGTYGLQSLVEGGPAERRTFSVGGEVVRVELGAR